MPAMLIITLSYIGSTSVMLLLDCFDALCFSNESVHHKKLTGTSYICTISTDFLYSLFVLIYFMNLNTNFIPRVVLLGSNFCMHATWY